MAEVDELPLTYDVRFDWEAGEKGETWAELVFAGEVICSTPKLTIQSHDAHDEIEEVREMLLKHVRECLVRVFK